MKKLKAAYQEVGPGGSVRCLLCPHHCLIFEGREGLCQVRSNDEGTLVAKTYSQVAALSLDPIEKKPLAHFEPGSMILSVGFHGCNMACPYCQNASLVHGRGLTRQMSPEDLALEAERLKAAGNIGLAYTYNEPTVAYEMLLETSRLVKDKGMKNILVSNGLIEEAPFSELLPDLDALNIDVKSYDRDFYRKVLRGDLETTWATIRAAFEAGKHLELTYLVLTGHNDNPQKFSDLCRKIATELSPDVPIHLSRSFPQYQWQDLHITPQETMTQLADKAEAYLSYVYLGNI